MKIYLLGLPGSGKTTLGQRLAQSLGTSFVDLDAEIEKAEKMSIRRIFEEKKEIYFRRVESEQLKRWSRDNSDFVMATGGGAPCFFDNMEVINRTGKSIFLDVPPKDVAARIMERPLSERPLFATTRPENLEAHLREMRQQRMPFYGKAYITVSGDRISEEELLAKIRTESQQ